MGSAPDNPPSDADFALAKQAVAHGWLTEEELESALVSRDRSQGTRLIAHLPLTPAQIRALEESAGRPTPAVVLEARKDPANRIGRYWLVDHLKTGGMGAVYRAWDGDLARWVALKFLKDVRDDVARAYFRREAELAAGLDHPHIAKIFEVGEHPSAGSGQAAVPFIAMQFVDGENLAAAKKDLRLEEKLRAARDVAEAVRFAHEHHVIHRDLKPANVMITRPTSTVSRPASEEERGRPVRDLARPPGRTTRSSVRTGRTEDVGHVYVMDFGLAKRTRVEGQTVTVSGAVVGTPNYMAPEQARGKADEQSDIYGLGAILYDLVTGRPPFTGESPTHVLTQVLEDEPIWPRRLDPTVPIDVEAVILHALEKDPARRYRSMAQVIEDLDAALRGEPLRYARRPTLGYVLSRKIRKQPLLWSLAAALLLTVAGGAAFGAYWLVRARRQAVEKLRAEERARGLLQEKLRAEERARGLLHEQVRADKEEALRLAAERRRNQALAETFLVRAQQEVDEKRLSDAALLYAEANVISPSLHAAANARYFTTRAHGLVETRKIGGVVYDLGRRSNGELLIGARAPWKLGANEVGPFFSPDGRYAATLLKGVSKKAYLVLRRTKDGSRVGTSDPGPEIELGATPAFSRDGSRIFACVKGGIQGWTTVSFHPIPGYFHRLPDRSLILSLCTDFKGTTLYYWDSQFLRSVDLEGGRSRILLRSREPAFQVHRILSTPLGRGLLLGVGKFAFRFDLTTGQNRFLDVRHDDYIDGWDWSPDGRLLATGSRDGFVRIWTWPEGKSTGTDFQLDKGAYAVRFWREGRRIAAGGPGGVVHVWALAQAASPKEIPIDAVKEVSWIPGGKKVLIRDMSQHVSILNPETQELTGVPIPVNSKSAWVSFSEDGRFAHVSGDTWVVVDLRTGRWARLRRKTGFRLKGGRVLATEGKEKGWIWTPFPENVRALPDAWYRPAGDSHLLAIHGKRRLLIQDVDSLRTLGERSFGSEIKEVAVTERGTHAAVLLTGGEILFLTLPDCRLEGKGIRVGPDATWLMYRRHGEILLAMGKDGVVLVWDRLRRKELIRPPMRKGESFFTGPAFSPDHLRALYRDGNEVRLWDTEKGSAYGAPIPVSMGYGPPGRFTSDGASVLVTTSNAAYFFDAATGKARWPPIRLPSFPDEVDFLADDRVLLFACRGEGVVLYDAASGRRIARLFVHGGARSGMWMKADFDPTTKKLLTYHQSSLRPTATTLIVRDLGFLFGKEDPRSLRERIQRHTGLRLTEAGAIEPAASGGK